MALSNDNPRPNLLQKLSAHSGVEAVYNFASDFPHLPDYVLHAASRGWRIFPTPARCWVEGIGADDASSELTQLSQWARDLDGFNWSLATGPESGVFALVAEEPHGMSSLRALSQLDWPETLHLRSRNSIVAFWGYPADMRAVAVGRFEIAPGLAVLADGESVVLPGHESANWPALDASVLQAPAWLIECAFKPIEPAPAVREAQGLTLIRGGLYGRGGKTRQ